MDKKELFNFIFFAFVLCVVLAIVRQWSNGMRLITVMALAAGLWLGWDSLRMIGRKSCGCASPVASPVSVQADPADLDDPTEPADTIDNPDGHADIAVYSGEDIRTLHSSLGCGADNQLCNRMKYTGSQAKMSQDIRARFNKYSLMPYLEEEMRENEELHWWESDDLDEDM